MYHRIGSETFDPWGLVVGIRRFEAQLEWLARNRTLVPLSEFVSAHRDGRLDRDAVAITFDDGYASTIEAAVPILERLGLVATVFLPTGAIESCREFWWDELERLILEFDGQSLRLENRVLRVPERAARDHFWSPSAAPSTPRQKLFYKLWSDMRMSSPAVIKDSISAIRSQTSFGSSSIKLPLNRDQVRSIGNSNFEFGSHSVSHSWLPRLKHATKVREIRQSRLACESLTASLPTTFAYPYGAYDNLCARLVEKAGYVAAVTSDHGCVQPRTDAFCLPRLRIGDWSAATIAGVLNS